MDDLEFAVLKRRLHTLIGLDLEAYKAPQVRRRLDGYLSRLQVHTVADFNRQLAGNPAALAQLRDFLAINVSSFFRDYDKWIDLNEIVLPHLLRQQPATRPFSVWSAACSHGAEAYSLAMLLDTDGAGRRATIQGTDIDQSALRQAQAGGPYTGDEVRNVPASFLSAYFTEQGVTPAGGPAYYVAPRLRSRVRFFPADLLQPGERGAFDLIICRNVLIYFTDSAKQQVVQGLTNALAPGGVLFIGATESIGREGSFGLQRIALSFYRRIA
jgi:chemotaxis protein methyltransferase CheR